MIKKMNRRYQKLRDHLKQPDIRMDYPELARCINRSVPYVANRMRGVGDFTRTECYMILAAVGLPAESIFEYFPPDEDTPRFYCNGRMRVV